MLGIVPDMNTAPGLAPPIPPARGLDLEYEIEGFSLLFSSLLSLVYKISAFFVMDMIF